MGIPENLKLVRVSGLDADCMEHFRQTYCSILLLIAAPLLSGFYLSFGALFGCATKQMSGSFFQRLHLDGDATRESLMDSLIRRSWVDCEMKRRAEALYITVRWPKRGKTFSQEERSGE